MTMSVTAEGTPATRSRNAAIAETIERLRKIEAEQGVTRRSLAAMQAEMTRLAAQRDLFPDEDFPPPADGSTSARYLLSKDADDRFALYAIRLMPGKLTDPHNHTTWAVVAGVEGVEHNWVFRRTDDGSVAGKASLEVDFERDVGPGGSIALLPTDIHAIAHRGSKPALHLHMYGLALEKLGGRGRLGFDLKKGTVQEDWYTGNTIAAQ